MLHLEDELEEIECPLCHEFSTSVERRRQWSSYADDELNFVTCCLRCFDYVEDCWRDQWADYYGSR